MSTFFITYIQKERKNWFLTTIKVWALSDVARKCHVLVAVVWFSPSLWQEEYIYKAGLRLVILYQASGDKICPTQFSWLLHNEQLRSFKMQKVQEQIRLAIQYGWDWQSSKEIVLLWKPGQENVSVRMVVGMMTDKGSLVWVIKKRIGGLTTAALAACWLWTREQRLGMK